MTPSGKPLGLARIRRRFKGSVLSEEGAAELCDAGEESRMYWRRVNGYYPVLTVASAPD